MNQRVGQLGFALSLAWILTCLLCFCFLVHILQESVPLGHWHQATKSAKSLVSVASYEHVACSPLLGIGVQDQYDDGVVPNLFLMVSNASSASRLYLRPLSLIFKKWGQSGCLVEVNKSQKALQFFCNPRLRPWCFHLRLVAHWLVHMGLPGTHKVWR